MQAVIRAGYLPLPTGPRLNRQPLRLAPGLSILQALVMLGKLEELTVSSCSDCYHREPVPEV